MPTEEEAFHSSMIPFHTLGRTPAQTETPLRYLERQETMRIIDKVLKTNTDERRTEIIKSIYLDGITMKELGAEYGISPARIRQLKIDTLWKLRRGLKRIGLEDPLKDPLE